MRVEETRLALDDVEHLLMKALALKLIRGEIDQVDSIARISWVQPRVLSREQVRLSHLINMSWHGS